MNCQIISLAKQLVSIPSISPFDKGCQNLLLKKLKSLDFQIKKFNINSTSNFWAFRGVGKTLTFLGHTDVVPPGNEEEWKTSPFVPTIKNKKLYGRGISDMKGALAAMFIAAEQFITKNPNIKGRLSFIITSDEESKATNGTVKVVDYLMKKGEKIDYCIIGEPSSKNSLGDVIKIGRRGSITAELTIFGEQGHVAYPKLSINPIHISLPFLNELRNIKWDLGNKHFERTHLQITNITSESNVSNLVPGKIKVIFNLRFSPEIKVVKIKETVSSLLIKFKLNYSIKWNISGMPFLTKKNYLIKITQNSIKHHTNITPKLSTSGGTSDGRFISLMQPEIVEFGLLNKSIHKKNEYSNIKDIQKLMLIYKTIMKKILL